MGLDKSPFTPPSIKKIEDFVNENPHLTGVICGHTGRVTYVADDDDDQPFYKSQEYTLDR
jgi:hypothetical protein